MDLQNYPNKEAVWANDTLTEMIQERVETMPDLPHHIAILLTWQDDEDESIKENFPDPEAIYDHLVLKWFDKPFRIFFFDLSPDSSLSPGSFLTALSTTKFSECFHLVEGKAVLRSHRLESVEEAQENYRKMFGFGQQS